MLVFTVMYIMILMEFNLSQRSKNHVMYIMILMEFFIVVDRWKRGQNWFPDIVGFQN